MPKSSNRFFEETVTWIVLPSIEIHMVLLTVIEDIMEIRCAKTARSVRMFKKARTEYNGARAVDGNDNGNLLV